SPFTTASGGRALVVAVVDPIGMTRRGQEHSVYAGETLPAGFASLPPAALRAAREIANAFSLRMRLADVQSPSVQFRAIELFDCSIRCGGVAHFHKCKTTRASRVTTLDQVNPIHGAITFKQSPDARFGRAESKVSNENVSQNILLRS